MLKEFKSFKLEPDSINYDFGLKINDKKTKSFVRYKFTDNIKFETEASINNDFEKLKINAVLKYKF